MKKLFAATLLVLLSLQYGHSSELNITLQAGDLINQVDVSKLDEVDKLTISGDINGTDVLVIRKMVNLQEIDLSNANIVSGGMAYYDGYYTTNDNRIGPYMFSSFSQLKHFVLPSNVIFIDEGAFSGCANLEEIAFTNKIYSIGDYAFSGCKGLRNISIPPTIKTIGFRTFYECENLTEVIIADNEERIYMGTPFESCPIISLYIGRDIQYSEFYKAPFKDITTLKNVSFSDKVTFIGVSSFYGCSRLETIDIPNSVERIFDSAFRGCESLKSVHLPNNITMLLPYTFYGCSSLQEIKIPNSVTAIGDYAFTDCKSLASVNLPDSLTVIGDYAFSGCNLNLTSIQLPHYKSLEIGASAFANCNNLVTLSIPSNVRTFGALAFGDCENLREVIIEDGDNEIYFPVTSVSLGEDNNNDEISCFRNCPLKKIYIGRTIEKGTPFVGKKTLSSVSFGEKIKKTPSFCGCVGLTSVSLPNSVEMIESQAFEKCESLSSIQLSNNLKMIPWRAFYGCKSLKEITIPSSVNALGGNAFHLCSGLTSVISLNPTPPTLTAATFDEETEKNAMLYVPTGSKNLYWISRHWENFYNIVETDLSSINRVQTDNDNTIQSVYSVDGKKLNVLDTSVLPKGVYIINGKKRLIK